VIGVVLLILLPLAAIGHYHATRNSRRHAPGELTGAQLYETYCARCHLPTLTGSPPVPSLLVKGYTLDAFTTQVRDGKGLMPSFRATLDPEDYARLHAFVSSAREAAPVTSAR
jgi:mono/diheme cytochrome c family protein